MQTLPDISIYVIWRATKSIPENSPAMGAMKIRNRPFVRKLLGGLDHLKLLAAMSQHSAWHYWDSVNWWNRLKFVEISLSGSCWSIHHGFFSKVALINKNGISGFLLSLRAWANAQTWTHFLSWIDTCGYAQARPTPDKWKADRMITCLRLSPD